MKLLVTGANGFVGQAFCEYQAKMSTDQIVAAVRRRARIPGAVTQEIVGDIGARTAWQTALDGVDTVVHLAGRAHRMRDTSTDPLAAFRAVNTEGTLNLAGQAARAGVKRLVFLSTIKVSGEGQSRVSDDAYTERQPSSPSDAYAVSKYEAELGLRRIAKATGLEVTILRPPLVYGPGVGANFLRLMQAVNGGWPLPFGGIDNRRDLLFLGNLVDAISVCTQHPAASNKTFLLADGEGLSTPELIRRISAALNRPARLISVPPAWLRLAAGFARKTPAVERLLGSLMVDSAAISQDLAWQPPYSVDEGLAATARWFREHQGQA